MCNILIYYMRIGTTKNNYTTPEYITSVLARLVQSLTEFDEYSLCDMHHHFKSSSQWNWVWWHHKCKKGVILLQSDYFLCMDCCIIKYTSTNYKYKILTTFSQITSWFVESYVLIIFSRKTSCISMVKHIFPAILSSGFRTNQANFWGRRMKDLSEI